MARSTWKWSMGALMALGAALAAGCASGPPIKGTANFDVHFDKNRCPVSVTVPEAQRNCPGLFSAKADCVKVTHEATVEFAGGPADQAKPFAVYFQPFGPLHVREGKASVKIDPQAPEKEYVFSVVAEACPVLDPIIIIER